VLARDGAAYAQRAPAADWRVARVPELAALVQLPDELAAFGAADELTQIVLALAPELEHEPPDRDLSHTFVEAATALARIPAAWWSHPRTRFEVLADAVRVAQRLGDHETEASAAWTLAVVQRDAGRRDDARRELERVLVDCPRALAMLPYLHLALADLGLLEGEPAAAAAELDRAEAALRDERDGFARHRPARCTLLGLRGELELDRGLPDRASTFLEAERELAESLGDPVLRAAGLVRRSQLWLATRRFRTLEREVDAALADEVVTRVPGVRALLLVQLGKARATLARQDASDDDEARAAFDAALDAAPSTELKLEATTWLADLALRRGELDRADELLARTPALDPGVTGVTAAGAELFALAAAVRADLALRRGDPRETLEEILGVLERSLEAWIEAWGRVPRSRGGSAFLHTMQRRRVLSSVITLSVALTAVGSDDERERGVLRALGWLLRFQELGSLARELGYRSRSLDEVRRELVAPGEGFLAYVPASERSHVFALEDGRVRHAELASEFELRPARERGAEGANTDVLRAMLLPAPIAELVDGWRTLTVVGIDLLGYVPFERLVRSELSVRYLPSFPVGCLLAARAPATLDSGVRLVGAPELAPELAARWPELETIPLDEARALEALDAYDREQVSLRLGRAATRDALAATPGIGVLEVIAHGVHDPARARPAALVLAPSSDGDEQHGIVSCDDVETLRAPSLVLLAVCGAGRGPLRRGEDGIATLGGAFLRAGARTVVLPAGPVEYEASVELLRRFHRHRARGLEPAEALRRATGELPNAPLFHVVGL
jgi:tetratricopeptide (TPR) repeat protein